MSLTWLFFFTSFQIYRRSLESRFWFHKQRFNLFTVILSAKRTKFNFAKKVSVSFVNSFLPLKILSAFVDHRPEFDQRVHCA